MAPKTYPIRYVLTHFEPHKDELTAYLDATIHGQTLFPGITTAPWVFVNAGQEHCRVRLPNGQIIEIQDGMDALRKGFLPLGVLKNNPFNEHKTSAEGRRDGDCCATLMAKYLGSWENDPAWRSICRLVLQDDEEGVKTSFDLSLWLSSQYRLYSKQTGRIIAEGLKQIRDKYLYELSVLADGRKYSPLFKVVRHKIPGRRELKIVSVTADSGTLVSYVNRYYKRNPAERPDVFIQWHSSGHVQIHAAHASNLNLDEVAEAIRRAEAKKWGVILPNDPELLRAEGNIPQVPNWGYLLGKNRMNKIVNGGFTGHTVTPTRLKPEELVELVKANVKAQPAEPAVA